MFRRRRPVLVTARLRLRPLSAADVDAVMALAGAPGVARMLSDMPYPATRAEILRWLACRPGEVRFAIEHRDQMIGSVGYYHEGSGSAELGFWLGVDWWGQGLTLEAARAVVAHGFARDGVRRFTSAHFLDNRASAKVLAQLGFKSGGRRHAWCPARGMLVEAQTCSLQAHEAGFHVPVQPFAGLLRRLIRRAAAAAA